MNKIKKGDTVLITAGKDKGQKGSVVRVIPEKGSVVVQGKNIYKRHRKPAGDKPGAIIEIERPLPAANVAVICGKCEQPTRIGFKTEAKNKLRYCKKCEAVL